MAGTTLGMAYLGVKTTKEAIETVDKAIDLYNKVVDEVNEPYRKFIEALAEMERFRFKFNDETSFLIGRIQTAMMNGMDAYHQASTDVYGVA